MADNVLYAEPAGGGNRLMATDEIGGVNYTKVKIFDATAESIIGAVVDALYGLSVDVKRLAPELLTPMGYGQIDLSSGAAVLLSTVVVNGVPGIPAGTKYAVMTPETQGVRFRCDNTAPTASVGNPIAAGDTWSLALTPAGFATVKVIQQSASAKLNVEFFA